MQLSPPSARMKNLFLVAIVLMFAHKVECWYTDEWLESPFFQTLIHSGYWVGHAPDDVIGEAMFLTFTSWLFAGLIMGWLVMRGGWAPTVALGIWGLTFVLEWHHVVRTVWAGEYYSGVFTAGIYLPFGLALYWPELLAHVHWRSEGREEAL